MKSFYFQFSFEFIFGLPGQARSFSIYISPLLWRWGTAHLFDQSNTTMVERYDVFCGPFAIYVSRR